MSVENARERFIKAIGILVDEKDRIKERLLIAYAGQLSGIDPSRDLPDSMVNEFNLLKYALCDTENIPYVYGGSATKKIHDVSEDDASEIARRIFSMFLQLHDLES
jgi:hypothetical protein